MPLLLCSLQRSLPQLQSAGAYLCNANTEKSHHVALPLSGKQFGGLFQVVCNAIHSPLILKLGGEFFSSQKLQWSERNLFHLAENGLKGLNLL